jgi:transposase
MEACGSAHYWARELIELGHEVRLMPAAVRQALREALATFSAPST